MAKRRAISFTRSPKGESVEVDDDGTTTFRDGSKLIPPPAS